MHYRHHPTYWLAIAAALALALLAFDVAGQTQSSTNANAIFQGRPYMSGAQGGLGAQAGPPQGGIGLQGSDGAGRSLRRPHVVDQQVSPLPPVACADVPRTSAGEKPLCLPQVGNERFERRLAILGIDAQQRGRM
ncbi:MAG: hypothetical protein JWP22_1722 [Ramlibacter sp.]|jgi:hypothetical protein|nr:hypothetical protein [Ramlibacter sp.]MDB5913047.1 hypothetical protein [Ramlibacter sp.]